jgi:SAM-dependent methyltransferase
VRRRAAQALVRVRRLIDRSPGGDDALVRLTDEDRRYLKTLHDESTPLPPGAEADLSPDNPRLRELREQYDSLTLPVASASRWSRERVEAFLDLRYFRGETLIVWHYRELPRITKLKYFVFAKYVAERDPRGYLGRLGEDGAFGCWTYAYPGLGRVSRDLLESVNEIAFLDRALDLPNRERFSVLDIGAGYGRLAHRMVGAHGERVADYCCVDAVPESTFVSEYYLRHRGVVPPVRVVSLGSVERELEPRSFDLAVNVHSFPEMPYAAIQWWVELLARLEVSALLIVPNKPTELLSLEPDGTRQSFMPLLERHGYVLSKREPVIQDEAVRELVELHDHFHLFTREVSA